MDDYNLDISAISYTDKDFRSIYPEMLDLAKKLTNRWDPSKSNESDPGVVLLKEAAFVADHNNYNIDKNILENFLPSATQDRSVRNITEMNGYTPRYYVSANGEVTLTWKKPEGEESTTTVFTIPKFTLVLADSEDTVAYTQIDDIVISGEGTPSTGRFIEGTLQTLSINDTSVITLENLDDNNRVYLPESMVAQNGIYIKNTNSDDYDDYWVRNNYLLTQPTGSRVYKIDYDSYKSLPFIEFPSDISNLIGDGLEITYISTSGESGNISANTLSKIISPSSFTPNGSTDVKSTETFTVNNASSITNGKNPETINEMYQSFRKVVGTFDTLVTCKDYSNKIYELVDSYDNPLVSNAYVTDRRTEYNKSVNVISYDVRTGNKYFKNISVQPCSLAFRGTVETQANLPLSPNAGDMYYVTSDQALFVNMSQNKSYVQWENTTSINLNDFSLLTAAMTPYDLCIYALKAFAMSDYLVNQPAFALNNSFTPVNDKTLRNIKAELENTKCICHTYNDASTGEVFCFKNYAPLKVRIYLYNKIKEDSKQEILTNIYKALSENFNPRHLEFGKELVNEDIKNVIIKCDNRIKDADVALSYNLYAMYRDGSTAPVSSASSALLTDLVAKNVLAGRVCLFEFDDEFNYDYGQVNGKNYDNVTTIETELPIELNQEDNVLNYYTSEVKRSTDTYISDGTKAYWFRAPNLDQETLLNGTSYVLKGDDIFIMYPIDETGKILKDQGVEYQSYDEVTYIITNSLDDGAAIVNNKTTKTPIVMPNGEFIIMTDDSKITTNEGVLNLDYVLNENEAVQIIHPNYYSEQTYSMYVNYRYIGTTSDRIYANTEHTLGASEKIVLVYTNNGETKQDILFPGQIVRSSFNLIPTDELKSTGIKKSWTDTKDGKYYDNDNFRQLTSNQTISTRKPMKTVLESSGIWCYWIINSEPDGANRLFSSGEKTRILRGDEYFIYANSSLSEMMILGSGTMLTRSDSDDALWYISEDTKSIDSITEDGTSVEIPWQKNLDFVNNPFTITEMNVITLGQGDRIIIFDWDKVPKYINNENQFCNGSIRYTISGTDATLPKINNFYQIRSRLDINSSKNSPQKLYVKQTDPTYGGGASVQKVIINNETITSEQSEKYLQTSRAFSALGDSIKTDKALNIYRYELDGNDYSRNLTIGKTAESYTFPFFYLSPSGKTRQYIIPVHINGDAVNVVAEMYNTVGDDVSTVQIKDYNTSNEFADSMTLKGNSSYYITPSLNTTALGTQLTLKISWTSGTETTNEVVTIGDITIIEGLNSDLEIGTVTLSDVLTRIDTLISGSDSPSIKPYYPYVPDNSIVMDNTNFEDANAVWDINNIANSMTIPQIDIANSEFVIPSSMIIPNEAS